MKKTKTKYEKIWFLIKNIKSMRLLINTFFDGYLYDTGWSQSVISEKPVDSHGEPLPWISIPTIEILKEKDLSSLTVFEFGAGNSTIWFSKRVKNIISVEHDKKWFEFVKKLINACNSQIIFKKLSYDGDYSKVILDYENIDIALVDGRDRVNCLINSINKLSKHGVIILDDSQRENYQKAINIAKENGFKDLNLVGMNVGRPMKKTTTIFYRDNNCLGL